AVRSSAVMLPVEPMEKYTAPSRPTATLFSACAYAPRRSGLFSAGLSQFLLGENFTVIPRCGQTQRIGTRRIGTRRIRVRYRMFAPRPHLSREEVGSR